MTFTTQQVISREGSGFACRHANLSVGRDGKAYLLSSAYTERGVTVYLLRTNLDGSGRQGMQFPLNTDNTGGESFIYATANAKGFVALASNGSPGQVALFPPELGVDALARCQGHFAGGAPYRVEAGAVSGSFYALAQSGLLVGDVPPQTLMPQPQIVVIGAPPDGQVNGMPTIPLPIGIVPLDFRVRETGTADAPAPVFYVLYQAPTGRHLAKIDHTGSVLWDRDDQDRTGMGGLLSAIVRPGYQWISPDDDGAEAGGYDIADSGHIYLLAKHGTAVYRIPDDGATAPVALPLPADAPSAIDAPYRELRIIGSQALLQRYQDRELFGVFTLPDPATTGSLTFVQSVLTRHDLVTAEFADTDGHAYWTAGSTVTATVTVNRFGEGAETAVPAPSWRAWIRSIGAQDHRELSLTQTDAITQTGATARTGATTQTGATTVQLAVPADLSGLFQLTIAPHTGPWRTGIVDEYRLRRVVEVRPAGVIGSVSISTNATYHGDFGNSDAVSKRPFNRLRYAAGEPMTVTVSVRQETSATRQLVLRLDDVSGSSPVTIAQTTLSIAVIAKIPATVTVTVPGSVTGLLRPGEYVLTTTAADLTVAAQPIELGPGRFGSGYRRVLFGDLQVTSPSSVTHFDADDYLDAADTAAVFLERSRRLGWTLVVDRILESRQGDLARPNPGYPPGRDDPNPTTPGISETVQQLTGDPTAVDPAKLWALTPFMDIISGYGAQGVGLRSLVLGNDTFLPLAELGPAPRSADPVGGRLQDLAWTNQILSDYPAFDGWHWAGNWWIIEHSAHGLFSEGSLTGTDDKTFLIQNYHEALFNTRADGLWRPILAAWFAHAVDHLPATARMLRKELLAVTEAGAGRSDLVTAYAGPALQAFFYPPDSFAEADEVDLQNQQEQYPLMLGTPFWLDFCRRPGKAVVLHEENYNDSGTGDQVLGQAFEALMRGADTSGHAAAGNVTGAGQIPWFRQEELLPDPRYLGGGLPSMFRVLSGVLHEYGEWVAAFASADPVAILLSRRQFAVQDWHGRWPGHTGRILEAYISLLYAHIPASLVFVEDLALPGVRPITDYSAVLLVNERVELDPRAVAAIREAQAAGVPVFHDGTIAPGAGSLGYDIDDSGCLDSVVSGLGSTSLGTSFGLSYKLTPKTGDYVFSQEAADFQIFTTNNNPLDPPVSWVAIAQQHLPHLTSALSGVVGTGHAGVIDGQVMISERRHGAARIVVAVNNSIFSNDPHIIGVDNAIFRRADVLHSVRAPLTTGVTLPPLPDGAVVYDVFGGGQITQDSHGNWPIDLRHWPAAILAVLPGPITGVSVSAAPVVSAGGAGVQEIEWAVRVVGGSDTSGDVPLPVRLRMLDDGQGVLWEQRTLAPASGGFSVPVNARGRIRFEAVELVSGYAAVADSGVSVSPGASSIDLLTGPVGGGSSLVAVAPGISPSVTPGSDWQPAAERLGAHLSAITLTADGKSAVISAANWDNNLYTVDLATGTPGWQTRVGHQFTYQPRTLPQGIAVVGADLTAPSEFGLHIVDPGNEGTVLRRFDLYGTTPRWFGRTGTGMTDGRPPAFATAADGAWIASAGNLGLAVWNQDGTPRWSLPWWGQTPPTSHPGAAADVVLAALNESTLLVVDGRQISTYDVATGVQSHQIPLSTPSTPFTTVNGMATAVAVSPDGTTVAVATSHDGGRVLVLATADLTQQAVLTTRADELAWTPDGSGLITAYDTRVCRYRRDPAAGWALDRCYPAADVVHNITIAADGRIALGIEQGDLIVLDAALTPVFTADLGALPAPCWLPGGDLLTATWLGRVQRLNSAYQATWSSILRSTVSDMRAQFLAPATGQVASVIDPGSGIAPLSGPNLLKPNTTVALDPPFPGQDVLKPELPDPVPAGYLPTPKGFPWLLEEVVENAAAAVSNTEAYALLIKPDPANPVTFNAITLWDDPAHPESWLRDVRLDVRAGPGYRWRAVSRLISDQAAHSHVVSDPDHPGQPIALGESGQLRLVLPPGVAGNLRLAAIALHLTA